MENKGNLFRNLPAYIFVIIIMNSTFAQADSGYKLSPEDVLVISVWKEDGLTQDVLIRPDGKLTFPLVGHLQAAGRTAEKIQVEITARLKKYIPKPVVTVSIKAVSGNKIFVIGKVTKPGVYTVGRNIDVMQALTLAGGLTPFAAQNKIKIIRRGGGKQNVFKFRYSDVAGGHNLEQNIILKSGDTVVVN